MKKVLLLFIMLTATTALNLSWAQLGVGQQMQNNNFNTWRNETSSRRAPEHWNSLNSGTGSLQGLAANDFVAEATSYDNSSCVQLTCRSMLGVKANGGLTCGRFNAGSMTATNTANCTYTHSSNDNFRQAMTAYPDSVYIWTKTSISNSDHEARINIVIHNNVPASNNAIYQDPIPSSANASVVNTTGAVNEAKVVAKATLNFRAQNDWVQQKIAFDYNSYESNNTTPSYILATFSTNKTAGTGTAGDKVWLDDIVLIYNTRLATLTVNGAGLAGFNPDVTTYNYPTPICEGVVPTVAGTCQSAHASTEVIHNPSLAEPYTTIRVQHQNQANIVYKDYTINYTIVPAPDAPTITSTPICAPVAQNVTMTASSEGATAYRWYTTEDGSSYTEGNTYTEYGLFGTITYYVSALNSAGCESSRTPATAIVAANPDAPTAGNTTAVCSGGTGVFTATLPAGENIVCRWYATNSSSEVLATGTSFEIANLTQNTTRYAEAYNTTTGCYSSRTAVTVNVNSIPAVPTNLTGGAICGSGTVTLSATSVAGTICQWFAAETGGNALGSGNSFTTPSIASTTNYYVASYNESTGCSSARQMVTATINDIPAAPTAGSTTAVCPGETGTFTATLPNGENLQCNWYETSNSSTVLGTATSLNVADLTQNTSRFVSTLNTATGCESGRTEVTVSVKSLPDAPTLSGASRCGTGDVTLNVLNALNNATYTWYNANSTQVGTGSSYTAESLANTSTYYVTATVDGCTGASASVTATINELPAAPTNLTGGSNCGTGTVTLGATPAAGTICQWFAAAEGGSSLSSGNSYTTDEISNSTPYYVASYNSTTGCSSARQEIVATINPVPGAPVISGNEAICDGSALTLTATPGSNANEIKWYNSNDELVGSNATFTTPELNNNTTYTAKSYNSTTGCYSAATEATIVVNEIPGAPSLAGNSRCGTGNVTLNVLNALNDVTYTWYNANDEQVNVGAEYAIQNLASTTSYYVTATANGCTGASASVTATINAIPEAPTASNVELCEAGSTILSVSSPVAGYTYNWYDAATGGSSLHIGNSYEVNISANSTYYVDAVSAEGCNSTERTAVTATISGNPSAPVVPNVSRCGNGEITIAVENPNNAYTYKWYAAAEGGVAFATGSSYTIANLQEDVTYYVSVVTGNCESDRTAATAHIKAIPGAPELAGDSHCGTGNVTLNIINAHNDDTYTWYNANDEQVNEGASYEIQNLANTTTYYVTTTIDGCTGAYATVTATINAIPALPTVTDGANCGEGVVSLSATVGENGNQVRWFAAAEGGEAIGSDNSFTTPSISTSTSYYVASYNTSTQCIGARKEVVATINDIPAAPTASNDTLCGPGSAVLTAVPADNCNCQWFNANNIEITTGVSNDSRSLTTGNLSQNTSYRVRSVNTNTSCISEYTDIQVVVAPVPGAPTVSNNARCGEGDITLTATPGSNANTCRWYNTNSELVHEGTSYEIQDLDSTTSFICKSYNDITGCESSANNSRTAIATIYPIPAQPTVQGNNPICGSGSLTLTAEPGTNATICRWITGEDTTTNNSINTGNLTVTTNFTVQSYHASRGCASENLTVTVVVNTQPNAPQTGNDTQCLGTPVNLTATATENTIVRWYASAQDNNILYEGAVFHPENLVVGENNFYASLYDTLTQCTSANRSIATATMIDAPAIPNVADTAHCGPAAFTLNIIDPQNNTTYKWYEAAQGGVAIHTGTSFTTGELSSTTHYYVSAAVANYDCESGRKDVTVTINSIPANPVVNGNEAICAGQTLTVSASSDAAATNFVWSDGQNNTEGETFTTSILEDTTNYTVKAYNASTNCESETVNFTVAVNQNPGIPKVGSDTQCEHDTIMLTAFAATGCTSYWYTSQESTEAFANGDIYSTSTLPVGTTTYYVSQRDDITNCESERTTVEAIVNPTYAINYPVVACDSFQWNNETFTESGNYERTLPTQLGCDSVVTLQLTINRSVVTNIDTTVCDVFVWNSHSYETSGDYQQAFTTSQNCDSTVNVHLTVKKSTVGEDHIYLCSNELPYNYNDLYEVTAAGTFTIHTDNVAGCDSTITLTVTVNTQPSAAIGLTSAARCGEGMVTLTAHAGQNGTTCRWYASENDNEVMYTGTSITNNFANTTTYYVSSYNEYNGHPCESGRQAITATINTNPAEPTVEDQVRCGNGQVEFTATVDENANTCRWYLTPVTSNISATGLTYTPNINTSATNGTTFYVESFNTNTNCKSSRKAVKATAFVIPAAPALTPMSYCGEHQFSINAPTSGYYKWYENENSENALDIVNNTTPSLNASRSYFISHVVDYTGISCESNRTELALTIYPVYENQYVYDTICQGETYAQYGLNETFGEAGSFDRVINTVSSTNCDSLVTLRLWVKEIRSFAFDTTVCDSYTWNNETFTESENITRHFTSSIGCDSVVTVSLTVNKSVQTEFNATDCDEYTWNNETYNTSGDYVQHFFTVNGCDSMVTLHLTINNSVETQFSDIACDSYQWNNETYTTSGDYVQHFSTSNGCDSTVTLHLTINYSNAANLTDVVCAGTRYNANGFDTTFNVAGSYTLVRHDLNQAGCDSTTTLTLKVNPIYNQHVTLTICETALPYTWNDITYPVNTESGNYEHTYSTQTAAGCDSIVNLHLTISNQYVTPLTQDICEGENITFANQTLSQSDIYYDTLLASNHCDSIIMLTLTVHELHTTTLEGNICLGESYTSYDFDVTPETSGSHTYQRVVETAFGCDSTIILNLTVNPVYFTEENGSTCDYTEYIWNGHNKQIGLLQAGNYTIWDSLKTVNGCDSIFKLNLTVNPSYFYPETATVCDNEEYVWDGHDIQIGLLNEGTYTIWDSLKTVNQCDSVYQLTLTVNPTFYAENEGSTCANEAYVWQGHEHVNIGLLAAGEHIIWDSLKTVNNCDSVYKLSLTVYPTFYEENEANTCANEVYVWQGHEHINIGLLEAGEYIIWDSLETVNHCDSVYKLTLTVTPTFYEENEGTTCDNEAYVWQGHEHINIGLLEAGEYIIWDSLYTDTYACDSVYKLTLTVNETKQTDLYESICAGDYYEYNDAYYEESGDFDIHFQTALGCDSTVTLHLTVNPVYSIDTNITVCQGMMPYNFADTIFTTSGSKDVLLHTQQGCDSIYHVNLTVTPFTTTSQTVTICDNELPYSFLDSTFYAAGTYDVTETSEDGCNRITTLTLVVNPTFEITVYETACASYTLDRGTYQRVLTESGIYTDTLSTVYGCDSIVHLDLTINPTFYFEENDYVCDNETYVWQGHEHINIDNLSEGIYTIWDSLKTVNECDSVYMLTLMVTPTYNFEPVTATVCESEEYVWAGHEYIQIGQRAAGSYTIYDSLHTATYACDSIHTLILNVTPTYSFEAETATICDNEEYVWPGHEYIQIGQRTAGSYTIYDSLSTTIYGCDSVHTLILTVTPTYNFEPVTATVCENEEHVWAGHEYIQIGQRTAGTYTIYDSLHTENYSCDSVHTLILTVTPTFYQEVMDHTCDNEAYVWEGHNVEIGVLEAGVYTIWDSLTTNTYGCDSVYKLTLTVTPTFYAEETDTVCDNEAYVWEGHNVQTGMLEPGIHTIWDSLSTTYGCDSVYKLTLTVNHAVTENHTLTVCQSELPYTWRDKTFGTETTVGEHQLTYEMVTVQGCDSIVNLTLTVNPNNIYYDDPISFCEGGSYVWNNQTITESGTYTDTVDNQYGCYDVNILVVTVNPVYHYTEYDTVCDNELPVVWQGRQINQAGTHTADYQTINSCDSIYTLVLTVNPTYYTPETATVCDNDEYVWEGHNVQIGQRVAGTYTIWDSLTTANGCDSVYMLTLTVTPTYNFEPVTATVCDNEEYVWEGHEYIQIGQRAAGNYTIYDSLSTAIYGCDSVHTLILTVTPTYNFEPVTATVCDNEEYVWEGHNVQIGQRTAGSYTIYDSLSTAIYGCDSVHTLILTVTPTYNFQPETATVCDNEEYVWAGHEYIQIGQRTAGSYTIYDSLSTTIYGCDSVHTLILTVTPTYNFEPETATVCDNEEYVWPGHEYIQIGQRAAGTYTINDYLGTMNYDCDSVHTLILTVTPTYNFEPETATVCDNEEYVWPGHEYIQIGQRTAGTYTIYDNLETSAYGCDSVHTLILTVTPTYNFQPEIATVCENEEFVWAGHEYIQIGQRAADTYVIYDSLSTAIYGCDSVHTLLLTVTPIYNFEPVTATVCENEEYVWAGHEYIQIGQRAAGSYTIYDSLSTAIYGCDSVHTLILTVTPTYNFEPVTATVCENEEYIWEGHNVQIGQRAAGTYTIYDSLSTTSFGCDSIHTLILTVNPTKHSVETASACSNEDVYSWHNRNITATGIYYDTLATSLGCDSVCELRFTLLEPTFAVFTDTTCANAEYQGYGFEVTPTLSGDTTLVRMTENVAGCDSTITVNLYVKPLAYSSFDTIVCGAFQWNNRWYTASGEYQQSFTAANGCDSIVTLNLTIDTPSRDTIEVVACESYEWDGTIYTQSGVFSKIYPQAVGCDSIAVMILTINHSTEVTLYDTTCQAHRYQEYGFDTLTMNVGTFTLQRIDENAAGCDSIINLVLTVHRGYLFVDSTSTCDNSNFVWHGIHCDTTGVYYKNYETMYGCDSVYVLFLTVYPTYEVEVTDTAIAGTPYHNHGLNFTPQTPGTLNIDVPRTTVNGCDSTVHVTLVVTDGNGVDLRYLDKHITLFPNPTDNVFTVSSTLDMIRELTIYDNNGRAVLRQRIDDYSGQVNVENLTPGIYFVRMMTSDNVVTKKLIVR